MRYDSALERSAVLEALGDKVGEVDGGVDTYRFEDCAGVCGCRDLGLGEDAEVRDDGGEPWCGRQQFVEPLAGCCLGVLFAVVDYGICVLLAREEDGRGGMRDLGSEFLLLERVQRDGPVLAMCFSPSGCLFWERLCLDVSIYACERMA